jgi:hypothetical protein
MQRVGPDEHQNFRNNAPVAKLSPVRTMMHFQIRIACSKSECLLKMHRLPAEQIYLME